jgi:hypothetical protein
VIFPVKGLPRPTVAVLELQARLRRGFVRAEADQVERRALLRVDEASSYFCLGADFALATGIEAQKGTDRNQIQERFPPAFAG